MAHQVTVNADNVVLPDGNTYNTGDVVTLTDEQYGDLDSTAVSGGTLTDDGPVADAGDGVSVQGTAVAALADPATATVVDVANKVNELITALTGSGKPLA